MAEKTVRQHFDDVFAMLRSQGDRLASLEKENAKLTQELAKAKAKSSSTENRMLFNGRLGTRLYADQPDMIAVEYTHVEKMEPDAAGSYFGETDGNFHKDLKFPEINEYFLWAIDFALVKPDVPAEAGFTNTGLLNSFLCLSAKEVGLYPFALGAAETDWRYPGRDFFYGVSLKSGTSKLNNDAKRPSSDLVRPYGYVFPEDICLPKGYSVRVDAKPISSNNAWDAGETQGWDLYVILRMYEMIDVKLFKKGK